MTDQELFYHQTPLQLYKSKQPFLSRLHKAISISEDKISDGTGCARRGVINLHLIQSTHSYIENSSNRKKYHLIIPLSALLFRLNTQTDYLPGTTFKIQLRLSLIDVTYHVGYRVISELIYA